MKNIVTLLFFSFFLNSAITAQNNNFISYNQKIEIIDHQEKQQSEFKVYFDKEKNTIVKHIQNPIEMVTVSNSFGELSIYYPQTNQLSFQQLKSTSSKRSLIYYFANNQTDHLGLAEEGFTLISKNYEENYLVTLWKSPANQTQIDRVKMVFDQGIPVYAEYIDGDEKTIKKIYYTQYLDLFSFRMPSRIIEISYSPSGDSIVNRTMFSDIDVSNLPNNNFFNFKAPEDALPVQN